VSHLYLARVSAAGELVDKSAVQSDIGQGAALAFDGSNYWLAWGGYISYGDEVMIGRGRPSDLQFLDGAGKLLDRRLDVGGPPLPGAGAPCLAAGDVLPASLGCGDCYDPTPPEVRAARFAAADGTLLDAAGIQLAKGDYGYDTTVASDGTDFMVGWSTYLE